MALQHPVSSTPSVGGAAVVSRRPTQEHERDESEDGQDSEADMIDQILENYNFICHPELRLKFKQQWVPRQTPDRKFATSVLCLGIITIGNELVCCTGFVAVLLEWHLPNLGITGPGSGSCSKIPLKFLRIQFMASYNFFNKQPSLDYRITTKWSDGARMKRKERYHLGRHALLRCKWNMDLQLPDMEGHLGTDNQQMEALDVDYGRLDFEISQLDMVLLSPWGLQPPQMKPPQPLLPRAGAPQDAVGGRGPTARQQPPETTSSQQGPGNARDERSQQQQQATQQRGGSSKAGAPKPGPQEFLGVSPVGGPGKVFIGQATGVQEVGMPDWLISFLSNLSVKPRTQQ